MLRLTFVTIVAATVLGGCVGPPVLERQVLGYDEVTSEIEQKLLLLNIARVDAGRPIHFTTTSSIAATFDWTTSINVGGSIQESKGTDFFNFNWGASASENPTFSIIPISGQDFTKRILTPFKDDVFEFLVFQGGAIDRMTRLMGAGIDVQKPDGSFLRFISNDPAKPKEYEEFRRIAAHLRWLNDNRKLFVGSLVFEEPLVADFKGVPSAEDIMNGFDKGLRWRQKPDGKYEVTRLQAGRTVVLNYDPKALSNQQRFELNEKIKRNPSGFVYVDIRPDGPGGDFPIQGAIKLRSVLQIIVFIGKGIAANPEFDVTPDRRTGPVEDNPTSVLQLIVSDSEPSTRLASVRYDGKYYAVNDTLWDRATFATLGDLFQSAVGDVEDVGIPITISK
jgi:hypothetical protein